MSRKFITIITALFMLVTVLHTGTVAAAEDNELANLYGTAQILDDSTILLTPCETWKAGSVWFKQPVATNAGLHVEFSYWAGDGRNQSYGGADGILCTFADHPGVGEQGQNIGFVGGDSYAVEIDSYRNSSFDPNGKHFGIIYKTISNHLVSYLSDCTDDSQWHRLGIDYQEGKMEVYLDDTLIMQSDEVQLNEQVYLGFTAATGDGYNRHMIKDVYVSYGEESFVYPGEARSTEGNAYAVLTETGEFIFFRSNYDYENKQNTTALDIKGNSYTGTVYTGFEKARYTGEKEVPWSRSGMKTVRVAQGQAIQPVSLAYWFAYQSSLTSADLDGFDTSMVTDMHSLFYSCSGLESLNISSFDTGRVTDMSSMFNYCEKLPELDVTNFDTANVTDMSGMFQHIPKVTKLDLSNFNTRKVKDMRAMFSDCEGLTSLDLTSFNTGNVENMRFMFIHCHNLKTLDLSSFDTGSVTDMYQMFYYCFTAEKIYVSERWNTDQVEDSTDMLQACTKLPNYSGSANNDKSKAHYGDGGYLTYKPYSGGQDEPGDDPSDSPFSLISKSFNVSLDELFRVVGTYKGTSPDDFTVECSDPDAFVLESFTYIPQSGNGGYMIVFLLKIVKNGEYKLYIRNGDLSEAIEVTTAGQLKFLEKTYRFWEGDTIVAEAEYTGGNPDGFEVSVNYPDDFSGLTYQLTETDTADTYIIRVTAKALTHGYYYLTLDNGSETATVMLIIDYPSGFSAKRDGWSFSNSYGGFTYPYPIYKIPVERYREVFGDAYVNAARNPDGSYSNDMISTWTGSCMGMAETAVLYYLGKLDWNEVNKRYEDDFSTVNSYYHDIYDPYIFDGFSHKIYARTNNNEYVGQQIERYQILDDKSTREYKFGKNTTWPYLINYVASEPNGNKVEHLSSGDYIKTVCETINDSIVPLVLVLQGKAGGHAIVTRTDKLPKDMGNGWYRYYVYDPNNPYLSPEIIDRFDRVPDDCYLNWLPEDRYIELNPSENLWRYYGGVTADAVTKVWGCNSKESIIYGNKKEADGYYWPDLMYLVNVNTPALPLNFDGTAKFRIDEKNRVRVYMSERTSACIKTSAGSPIITVTDGEVTESNPEFVLDISTACGALDGEETVNQYTIDLKAAEYRVDLGSGSSIVLLDSDSLVSVTAENDFSFSCNQEISKTVFSPADEASFMFKLQEMESNSIFDNVSGIGTIGANDEVTVVLNDKKLDIDNGITDDGSVQLYVSNEDYQNDDYVVTINAESEDISVSDIKNKDKIAEIKEEGIELDQTELEILSGSTKKLTAASAVTWSSSDEAIATVDNSGKVKGIKPGYAVITAETANGLKATCRVRVLFTDIPAAGKYYSNPVYWAVENGITNGYTDSDGIIRTFKPQNNCTREAVVTFLWRLAGKPEPKNMSSPFSDVQDKGKYYYKAVLWAAELGITKGYQDGTFKPNAVCLREHVVTFLWRYAKQPDPKASKNPFNDVKSSDYYCKAAIWANENGIANGYSTGEHAGGFGPKLDCLREHVVTFLYRYAN